MTVFNQIPEYNVQITKNDITSKQWYFFLVGLFNGIAPAAVTVLTVGASPFTFQAKVKGAVIVQGGTVSMVQFSRDGLTNYATGLTAGMFQLNAGDKLIVIYTVAPNMTFIPQ